MNIGVGCSIVLFNKERDSVLIAKRSQNKKAFPGYWETIGGRLEDGENIEECLIREVKEELGCSLKWFQQQRTYSFYFNESFHIIVNHIGEINGVITIEKQEIEEIKWIMKNEIDNYEYFPSCKEKIQDSYIRILEIK